MEKKLGLAVGAFVARLGGVGAASVCLSLLAVGALGGCATPLVPYSLDTPPLVLAPASYAGVSDQRGRFREVFCAVLEDGKGRLPDHRTCDDALTRAGTESPGTGRPVHLGAPRRPLVAMMVPGIGWDCFARWLEPVNLSAHLRNAGFELAPVHVDSLSGTENNARQIRDAIMARPAGGARIVLMGYSKGAADVLEAIVRYPEIRGRLAAVVSAGGSVDERGDLGEPVAGEIHRDQAVHVGEAALLAGAGAAFALSVLGVALAVRLQEAYGGGDAAEFDAADQAVEPVERGS